MIVILLAQLALTNPVAHDAARAAASLLSAYIDQQAARPVSKVNPLSVTPTLVIPDTVVAAGDRVAHVAVTLSEPALRPLTWRCATLNGTAYSPAYYAPVDTLVVFQPGQTRQVVDVPLKADLGTRDLKMNCAWSLHIPVIRGDQGVIRQGPVRSALPAAAQPVYPPVARTEGRKLVFASTFMEPISPDAVPGAWRSRMDWGRVQTGNKEIAPYTHPSTDPGTDPHPIVDGKRVLQAQYVPTKDAGVSYSFSAPMLDSANLFTFDYGYTELRVKIDRPDEGGDVPAYWLTPVKGWPPELDIFEIGLGGRKEDQTTTHITKKPDLGEGTVMRTNLGDGKWHVVGTDITPDWIVILVDGVEQVRRHNPFPDTRWKIIVNIAVGGLAPDPKNPKPGWVSTMTLDYLKVWQ